MKITFNKKDIQALVDDTIEADKTGECRVPYTGGEWEAPEDNSPGLNLVGDDRIYFMSNRTNKPPNVTSKKKGGDPRCVIFALEFTEETKGFWHEMKTEIFGGDDGVNFFPLKDIEKWLKYNAGPILSLDITPDSIALTHKMPRAQPPGVPVLIEDCRPGLRISLYGENYRLTRKVLKSWRATRERDQASFKLTPKIFPDFREPVEVLDIMPPHLFKPGVKAVFEGKEVVFAEKDGLSWFVDQHLGDGEVVRIRVTPKLFFRVCVPPKDPINA